MKKILKYLFISFLTFVLSFGIVSSWTGLIPDNGDMITIPKWIELITELNTKVGTGNIIAGNNINITNSGSDVTIESTGSAGIAPFVSNTGSIKILNSSTKVVTLDGIYFTPNSNVTIPGFDGTINSVTAISPYQIDVDLTSGPATANYDIVVDNSGVDNSVWTGNGVGLLAVGPITGNGPAGIYAEDFESNTLGNWTEVTGLTANVSWQTVTGGTPSGTTGPNAAAAGTYYMYTEASNPNFPSMTYAVETDNFNHAQSISFDYHMYGADMGNLAVQTYYDGIWTDVYNLNGQQQTAETDAWINTGNIDLTVYIVEKIRIFYTSGANYTGDASIDNLTINSI